MKVIVVCSEIADLLSKLNSHSDIEIVLVSEYKKETIKSRLSAAKMLEPVDSQPLELYINSNDVYNKNQQKLSNKFHQRRKY